MPQRYRIEIPGAGNAHSLANPAQERRKHIDMAIEQFGATPRNASLAHT
jgi:hypothetical protein